MEKDTIELISNNKKISFKSINMKTKDINELKQVMKIRANQIFNFFSGEVCVGIFDELKDLFYERKLDELHNCDLYTKDNNIDLKELQKIMINHNIPIRDVYNISMELNKNSD